MNKDNNKYVSRIIFFTILISFLFFLFSLSQIVFYIGDKEESIASYGLACFLFGWGAIVGQGFSWLANPLLIFSWRFLKLRELKLAKIFSVLAFLISLTFLLVEKMPRHEGGGDELITSYSYGYIAWVFSFFVNIIGVFLCDKIEND